jgi:hypothetical protein
MYKKYQNKHKTKLLICFQMAANASSSEEVAKWSCQMCTYLNWPKAVRCAQCITTRRRVSPGARSNHPRGGVGGGPALSEAVATPPTLENLRINQQTPPPPSKWNCGVCTYENWPRTRKCVLCGAGKEATPTRESPPPTSTICTTTGGGGASR